MPFGPHDRADVVVQGLLQRGIDGSDRFERPELERRDGVGVEEAGRGGGCNAVRSPPPECQKSADGGVARAGDEDRRVASKVVQSGVDERALLIIDHVGLGQHDQVSLGDL